MCRPNSPKILVDALLDEPSGCVVIHQDLAVEPVGRGRCVGFLLDAPVEGVVLVQAHRCCGVSRELDFHKPIPCVVRVLLGRAAGRAVLDVAGLVVGEGDRWCAEAGQERTLHLSSAC